MLKERSHSSGEKPGADVPSLRWPASLAPVRTLTRCVLTRPVSGALGVSERTNEPIWPALGAPHLALTRQW